MAAQKKTALRANGVQAGVDTRRFRRATASHTRGTRWCIDLYAAGNYICNVDGTDYIFIQVLAAKAKAAGSTGAMNAIYRLSAAPNACVLLYGVKAIPVDTINASGWVSIRLHTEQGEDKFTEAE